MATVGVVEVEVSVRVTGELAILRRAFGRLYGHLVDAGHVFTPEDDLILGEAAEILMREPERWRD